MNLKKLIYYLKRFQIKEEEEEDKTRRKQVDSMF